MLYGPPQFEVVTLVVDGYALSGWQEVQVERSMESGAISFTLQATNTSLSEPAMALRQGQDIQIFTTPDGGNFATSGGDLLCAGAIDDYDAEYEGDGKVITVTGRSKGRDPIDCPAVNHKTGRVENKTLLDAANEFGAEFGVKWWTDQSLPMIPMIQMRPGEPMFAAIEREARKTAHMLAAQPDGSIKITRAGTTRHAGALVLGASPVTRCHVHLSPQSKRQPVVVRGQRRSGTGEKNLRQEHRDAGDGDDTHRPDLVIAEGDHDDDDLKRRAKWRRLRLAGKGLTVEWTVSTWRDQGGTIWDPGRLIANVADEEDLDCDLTLSTAKLTQNERGTIATLNCVDPRTHGGSKPQGTADEAFDPGDGLDD